MASDRLVRYVVTVNSEGAVLGMEKVSKATDSAANKMQAAGGRIKSLGGNMIGLGRSLTAVSLPLAVMGGYAVKSAIQFQSSMTLLQTQAGASAGEVKKLSHEVLALKNVAFGPEEISKALYYIRSDGYAAGQAMSVLKASLAGATVSGASLEETAYGLTSVLKTGLPDVKNAAGAMDTLNSIVGLGKLKWEDLNQALSTGFLATIKRTGLGLADVGTAFDAFQRRGVPPTQTATNLRKALIQMVSVAGSGASRKALAQIGITQYELARDLKHPHGLISALEDLQNHLNRVSPEKGNALLAEAFGRSKGAGTIFTLLETTKEQKTIEKEREKYASLQKNLAATEQTSQFKIKVAISEVKKALIELGDVLIPVVVPMFQKMAVLVKEVAEWFTKLPKPVQEFGAYAAIAALAAGPLLILFGNLTKVVGTLFYILPGLTKLLPRLGAATGAAGEAASGGIAALLPEIAALLAAAAAAYALYKAVKAIKDFLSPSSGGAKTPGAKALKALHQPSEFEANTQGALRMLGGGSNFNPYALGPGSSAEAHELLRHQREGYGQTEAGGKAAHETAEGRELRRAVKERNEFIIHNHLHLDNKEIAAATARFLRDNPSSLAAKHATEAVLRKSFINKARSAEP